MKLKQSRRRRRDNLSETIDSQFSGLGPAEISKLEKNYSSSIMEMFRVTKKSYLSIELTHLFNDEVYSPVYIDKKIQDNLDLEDVFLMTLGLKGDAWHVVYMSPPYD